LHAPSLERLALILVGAAILTLPILLYGDALLDNISAGIGDPRFGSLTGAMALFFAPTLVSGMVSPYAVRLLVADLHATGEGAGKLYFVSTFGSAAGTLLTSFYLVLYLEVNQILLLMFAISVLVGVLVWVRPARVRA
jgi:hypothetical protein